MAVVYVPGTFDGLHKGHRELIDVACRIAGSDGRVILAVNSDDFVTRHKGVRLMADHERRAWAAWVYAENRSPNPLVLVIDQDDEQKYWLDELRPDFVLHSDEYTAAWVYERYGAPMEWFQERGIQLLFKTRYPGISSTQMREALFGSKT